jgi:hypothetical protein
MALVACDDTLGLEPVNDIPAEIAIINEATALAALNGAYDALQDDVEVSYYSGDFTVFSDLSADDVRHSGTFDVYRQADRNQLQASNGSIEEIWEAAYIAINRTNVILEKVPDVQDIDPDVRDEIMGQAHFLRALSYHNLVKLWGGVPLRLTTPATVEEAAAITRATVDQVYAQILEDLDQAIALIETENDATVGTRGAAWALRSRVLLDRGDWAGVVEAADSTETYGYELATEFEDLFVDSDTDEDVFKIPFTPTEAHFLGWYYRAKGYGGRYELAPTCSLVNAFDASVDCDEDDFMVGWSPGDDRAAWSIGVNESSNEPFASKYLTGNGDEDLHVIRFAEVILNRAEGYARLGQLAAAVAEYNKTRVRAGLAPHVLTVDVVDMQDVLEAIWEERRLELAFEGFRWPDLVRTGRAVEVLGIQNRAHQVLYPIPQAERDVTVPPLPQNPGY